MSGSSQQSDALEGFFNFAEYENASSYESPSLSPETSSKNSFTRPLSQVSTPTIPAASSQQPALTGPSHQYELYKQQTGIVPGAIASTLAINQTNNMPGYNPVDLNYLGLSPGEDVFDFNTAPSGSLGVSDLDMEFDPNTTDQFFFDNNNTINPNALGEQSSPSMASQTSSVGRPWPGMHSQAAMAKRQQQQQQMQRAGGQAKPRTKSGQPTDPIVEAKITQLLNSMRAKPAPEQPTPMPMQNTTRVKKDEDEMDEDEKLLASEEGKKLSSKERRQLRNKVSARAFRSRRKEYISQLESEISGKVTENSELRARNRALVEENKRLSDLTRMLLSSPSFSDLLNQMSTNPGAAAISQQRQQQQQQPEPQVQNQQGQQQEPPKDVNPYNALQGQQQQIGLAMIPEQTVDFSNLAMDGGEVFNLQPQVFSMEAPEMTGIDATVLSGKPSNFVGGEPEEGEEKVQMPFLDRPVEKNQPVVAEAPPVDPEFEANPEFELYHSSGSPPHAEEPAEGDWERDIFGGIQPEKVLARYELVDAAEQEQSAILAMERVSRMCERLEAARLRIEELLET